MILTGHQPESIENGEELAKVIQADATAMDVDTHPVGSDRDLTTSEKLPPATAMSPEVSRGAKFFLQFCQ